ncbi:hypothetical protein BH10CYA1_BH10CYA1_25840 [soil metagenome]
MRNRNQKGEMSDIGLAVLSMVAAFGFFTVALLGGCTTLLKCLVGY